MDKDSMNMEFDKYIFTWFSVLYYFTFIVYLSLKPILKYCNLDTRFLGLDVFDICEKHVQTW